MTDQDIYRAAFKTMPKGPIHDAAQRGDVDTLRKWLALGVSPNELDQGGSMPLHYLCDSDADAEDRLACLHVLLEAGADVNAQSEDQKTPLHLAACYGPAKLVATLIKAGADVNRARADNYTPLHSACWRNDSDFEPALVLIRNGAAVDARMLIRNGAPVDARTFPQGITPLDLALSFSKRRLVPILLRAGAALPAETDNAYIRKVIAAGGFEKYAQVHLARVTKTVKSTLGLPARPARLVVEFWHHAGYY